MASPEAHQRKAELAASLKQVRERIERACQAAAREPSAVELLAVTKTFPALDAALLAELGQLRFAENKDQEAKAKVPEFQQLLGNSADQHVRWHMVGQLQRNKARSVARWADVVESVDSPRLAEALQKAVRSAREAGERSSTMDVLIQVSVDGDPTRGGCSPEMVHELAESITQLPDLKLRGVMAVAPINDHLGRGFADLAEVAAEIRQNYPNAVDLSAGMSGDLERAIECGSTRVRVGTALLGGRQLTSPF